MLVLTRRTREDLSRLIQFEGDEVVAVYQLLKVQIQPGSASLGITAPKKWSYIREEILTDAQRAALARWERSQERKAQ